MKPKRQEGSYTEDLFRSRLVNIINMNHPLVKLSGLIDWDGLHTHFEKHYKDFGRPGLPIRLVVGLQLLKHTEGLSDEALCERWERDPYMQYFCGEEYFQHAFPCDRSGMSVFRKRVGEEALNKLLQESLSAAYKSGALSLKAVEEVAIDTTVQEKAVSHPTDHGLLSHAIIRLGNEAKKEGIVLRQSYQRVAKLAAMKAGRYRHAKQMKRAGKEVKFLRIRLKRILRDINRKLDVTLWSEGLRDAWNKASIISKQKRGDKDYIYSWHAPETECIGKGKAHKPYEFGCKVSLATNIYPGKGGHFILHSTALHGRPYDGHTLQGALDDLKKNIGRSPKRAAVDQGYKGHKIQGHPTAIYLTAQKRGVTDKIKKWLKRRAVIEPIIGHAKNDGLLGRNYLKGTAGDKINAILAAVGFNLRQLLRFLKFLCAYIQAMILKQNSFFLPHTQIYVTPY